MGKISLARRLVGCVAAMALVALAACGSNREAYVERPVEELYNTAMDHLLAERFEQAVKSFDEVERQHPYSVWATRAQLMAAFVNYQANRYDDAILAAQRFIQLHPGMEEVAYAYYLVAASYYEQIVDVERDQRLTERALKSLNEVVRRFPQSEYARDARLKIDLTEDHLAGKEMAVGRYYQQRKQYLAALNRFKVVIDRYQTTSHLPEAMHRMIESYLALGLVKEADQIGAVLGYNYPGSDWYEDTFALLRPAESRRVKPPERPGFMTRAWKSVF
jgi:outer membrane protein assembly factor BamD